MDVPAVPPYGDLFERARKSRHITIQAASAAAGIVKQTWIDIVKGRTARPKADTLAGMALAVGVSPDRLESEGRQEEAADILREMLREAPGHPAPPSRTTGAALRPVPSREAEGTPSERERDRLIEGYPDDEVLQVIGRQRRKKASMVVAEMLEWLDTQASHSGNGTAG
jgi:transcriptional regulator with XRE-family HTH domain